MPPSLFSKYLSLSRFRNTVDCVSEIHLSLVFVESKCVRVLFDVDIILDRSFVLSSQPLVVLLMNNPQFFLSN